MDDPKAELERLNERALILEETIRDIDYQVERALHAVAGQTNDVGHAIGAVTERHNTQLGLMFDLGKVTAQIETLTHRIREQDERDRERQALQEWHAGGPQIEDHLDWLRPALDTPEPEAEPARENPYPHYGGEDGMLAEMHRKDLDPEEYLDWRRR